MIAGTMLASPELAPKVEAFKVRYPGILERALKPEVCQLKPMLDIFTKDIEKIHIGLINTYGHNLDKNGHPKPPKYPTPTYPTPTDQA